MVLFRESELRPKDSDGKDNSAVTGTEGRTEKIKKDGGQFLRCPGIF